MIVINRNSRGGAVALLGLALLVSAPAIPGNVHEYTITVDAGLRRLWVESRFASVVHNISARSRDAGEFLLDARDCDTDKAIRNRNRRLLLPAGGVQCLRYAVDLGLAARSESRNLMLAANNVLVSPSVWLWRPKLDANNEIQVQFRLPDNVLVAVPWSSLPEVDNAYRLTASPENAAAPAVFGDFNQSIVLVEGAELRVTLLQGNETYDARGIVDWVRDTANNIVSAYGRFPGPAAHIVVIPVGDKNRGDKPVVFGRVLRDGGQTVELLIDAGRPVAEFYGDWTATHEFSHLMLPYVMSRHRWISEGFAQYHQNVLLARAGIYSELTAWQNLYNGFERGRKANPELSPNEAAATRDRDSLMKVYWSGAALALMADVELRRRSNGSESLSTVLGRLQQCCLPSAHSWDGPELFTRMDSLIGKPLFMPLYRRHANNGGFPDVRTLLGRLGLDMHDDTVQFRRNAELAHVRKAITMPDRDIAGLPR